jgi:hypothetical protein
MMSEAAPASAPPDRIYTVKIDLDRRIAAALVIAGMLVGLAAGLAIAVGYARALPDAPINVWIEPLAPIPVICPGDRVDQLVYSSAREPIEIDVAVTFENNDGTPIRPARLGENLVSHLGQPHQQSNGAFVNRIFWTVPSFGAGSYYRTTGITTRGRSASAVLISRRFTIPPECKLRPANERYTLTLEAQGIDDPTQTAPAFSIER